MLHQKIQTNFAQGNSELKTTNVRVRVRKEVKSTLAGVIPTIVVFDEKAHLISIGRPGCFTQLGVLNSAWADQRVHVARKPERLQACQLESHTEQQLPGHECNRLSNPALSGLVVRPRQPSSDRHFAVRISVGFSIRRTRSFSPPHPDVPSTRPGAA